MSDAYFKKMAPQLMRKLMADFQLDATSAAAIAGNLGHESGGFTQLQELKPLVPGSRGGYGLAQWTGPRRKQYEAYCRRTGKDPAAFASNYAFLFLELKGYIGTEAKAIPAVKRAEGLEKKVIAFELAFLRAHKKYKHYASRLRWTQKALLAYELSEREVEVVSEPPKMKEKETMTRKAGKNWLWWAAGTVAFVLLILWASGAFAQELAVVEPTLGQAVSNWALTALATITTAAVAAVGTFVSRWLVARKWLDQKRADQLVGENLNAAALRAIDYARVRLGTTISGTIDDLASKNMLTRLAANYLAPRFAETMDDLGWGIEDLEEYIEARLPEAQSMVALSGSAAHEMSEEELIALAKEVEEEAKG